MTTRSTIAFCLLTAALTGACDDALLVPPAAAPATIAVRLSLGAATGDAAAAYDRADSVHIALFRAATFNQAILNNFVDNFPPPGALSTSSAAFAPQAETRVQVELGATQDVEPLIVVAALSRARAPLFIGTANVLPLRGALVEAPVELNAVPRAIVVAPVPAIMTLGTTAQIRAAVLFATNDTVPDVVLSYQSGNNAIVTVDGNGLVTARGEGRTQVIISAPSQNGALSASLTITVLPANPTIAGLQLTGVVLNAANCPASQPTRLDFSISFTDPNGNVNTASPPVSAGFRFFPSGISGTLELTGTLISGNGAAGVITFSACSRFGTDSSEEMTVILRDQDGLPSNPLTTIVPRPQGAPRIIVDAAEISDRQAATRPVLASKN